jgi:hypothetical protein
MAGRPEASTTRDPEPRRGAHYALAGPERPDRASTRLRLGNHPRRLPRPLGGHPRRAQRHTRTEAPRAEAPPTRLGAQRQALPAYLGPRAGRPGQRRRGQHRGRQALPGRAGRPGQRPRAELPEARRGPARGRQALAGRPAPPEAQRRAQRPGQRRAQRPGQRQAGAGPTGRQGRPRRGPARGRPAQAPRDWPEAPPATGQARPEAGPTGRQAGAEAQARGRSSPIGQAGQRRRPGHRLAGRQRRPAPPASAQVRACDGSHRGRGPVVSAVRSPEMQNGKLRKSASENCQNSADLGKYRIDQSRPPGPAARP